MTTGLPTGLCERGAIYPIIAWQFVAAAAAVRRAWVQRTLAGSELLADPRVRGEGNEA